MACAVAASVAPGWPAGVAAQTFSEFSLPVEGSFPIRIAPGPDGALWFTELDSERIGRITTAGVLTEYLTSEAAPYDITSGPDGALWFSESGSAQVGRITTTGAITGFALPTSNSFSIFAAGSDGALWFTDEDSNNIGRITTAGAVTEFPIPTVGSGPLGIAAGPDGALWFTETVSNKIGRITTAGVITEFPVPTSGSLPDGITTGPDGALWFTEFNANKIGRITTAGVVTEFAIPTVGSTPGVITAGPDGALWFTEGAVNNIGRITTAGVITEYPIPTPGSGPWGITSGPDGALWFAERSGNKIGRLAVAGLQVTPATNISASGPPGGPFTPTSFQYQLSAGTGSVNYTISGIPSWLNANFTSGTVTTAPTTVTFSLNNVGQLNSGTYTGTIAFTNTDTGNGNTTRSAALMISGALTASPTFGQPPLDVTFVRQLQQGDATLFGIDYGDGSIDWTAGTLRPLGVACIATGPCYEGVQSASHTYTSFGTYTANLLTPSGATVASVTIDVNDGARRPSHSTPPLTYQPGNDPPPQPHGLPTGRPPTWSPTAVR